MKNPIIMKSEAKARHVLMNAGNVMLSISGGSDSDIMLDIIMRAYYDLPLSIRPYLHFVWFDTGLEYKATKDHLLYLQDRYKIIIDVRKAVKSIPYTCKTVGLPFLSKRVSGEIARLQRHNFSWAADDFEILWKQYPQSKAALRWFTNDFPHPACNIKNNKWLREFLIENPPPFLISDRCCENAKKKVSVRYIKEKQISLLCTGVRKYEGGARNTVYTSCFDENYEGISYFRPLFWYKESDKKDYEELYNIQHSKCYTLYGLKRTGCAGCPFGRNCAGELEIIQKFEPKLYEACQAIFGKSYDYTSQYKRFCEERR